MFLKNSFFNQSSGELENRQFMPVNPHVFIIGEVGQGKEFIVPDLNLNQELHLKN